MDKNETISVEKALLRVELFGICCQIDAMLKISFYGVHKNSSKQGNITFFCFQGFICSLGSRADDITRLYYSSKISDRLQLTLFSEDQDRCVVDVVINANIEYLLF
jgi:hypothetical protein